MNKLKIIEGSRRQLECDLIEAICLNDMITYYNLALKLNRRANLTLSNFSDNTTIALSKSPNYKDSK